MEIWVNIQVRVHGEIIRSRARVRPRVSEFGFATKGLLSLPPFRRLLVLERRGAILQCEEGWGWGSFGATSCDLAVFTHFGGAKTHILRD